MIYVQAWPGRRHNARVREKLTRSTVSLVRRSVTTATLFIVWGEVKLCFCRISLTSCPWQHQYVISRSIVNKSRISGGMGG